MKTSVLLLVLLLSHFAFSVKHSLKFIDIASSGVPDFPEFTAAVMVDETVVAYCDTKVHVKEDWMEKMFDDNPQLRERYNHECRKKQPNHFRETLHNLKQRFKQSGGVHIIQRMSGCEWDDETGEINGFNQYSYNGEDFISFDLKTATWIAPSPQAYSFKLRWDMDEVRKKYITYHLTELFPEWLKMYVHFGKSALMRTVLPSVSLLQKSPSSPVTCHATGFYPDRAVLFWRKDGEELFEDVEHGEILPNHDRTFQMSVDLLKPPSEDWGRYECVFQLSAVKEDLVTKLHKDVIRTNHEAPHDMTSNVPIGVIAAVCCAIIIIITFAGVAYKHRNVTKKILIGISAPRSKSTPESSSEERSSLSSELSKGSETNG